MRAVGMRRVRVRLVRMMRMRLVWVVWVVGVVSVGCVRMRLVRMMRMRRVRVSDATAAAAERAAMLVSRRRQSCEPTLDTCRSIQAAGRDGGIVRGLVRLLRQLRRPGELLTP